MTASGLQRVWRPTDLAQYLHLHQERPERFLLAGGTLALPAWQSELAPEEAIYLPSILELREQGDNWCGAAVTLAEIAARPDYPAAFRQAARSIASPGIRNLATLGGNLASSGDRCLAVALLTLHAWVEYLDLHDATLRRVPLEQICHQIGGTIIRVGWTQPARSRGCFTKFGIRATSGMNLATVAVHLYGEHTERRCAIAIGATGVAPHRLPHAEQLWETADLQSEQAAIVTGRMAASEALVRETDLIPASYRREIVGILVERALQALQQEE